ncbi:MAG: hypothetical protein F6J98_29345 [Moorea sp. SIO4G2]|nr:hypothetical protein [Moorena sp. SIO4G2]
MSNWRGFHNFHNLVIALKKKDPVKSQQSVKGVASHKPYTEIRMPNRAVRTYAPRGVIPHPG